MKLKYKHQRFQADAAKSVKIYLPVSNIVIVPIF